MHSLAFRGRTLLLGFALSPLSLASAQGSNVLEMTTSVLSHPPGISAAATEVALGQFTPDAIPDAAVLHGQAVYSLYAPDRRNVWSLTDGAYTSIARLPKHFANGRDAVIATTASGLSVLAWDDGLGMHKLVPAALGSTTSWASATDLQVVASTGAYYEVLGLNATGDGLLRTRWDSVAKQFQALATIGVDSGTSALAALQWDGDTALEYATASAAGLVVYDDTGLPVTTIGEVGANPMLIAVTDAGSPQRVAWMRSPSSMVEQLTAVRNDGTPDGASDPAHYYYGVDVKHMALIDLGDDTRKELWITSGQATIGIGLRRGTSETFLPWPAFEAFAYDLNVAHSALLDPDPAPTAGSGVYGGANTPPVPAVMDFDGDGDDDLFLAGHPGQANRALVCLGDGGHGSGGYEEERNLNNPGRVKPWMEQYTFQISTPAPVTLAQSGTLNLDTPTKPTLGPAAAATHVRYAVWTQAVGATSVSAVTSFLVDLTQIPPVSSYLSIPNLHLVGNGGTVHIEVSYLKLGAGAFMEKAYPAMHEALPLTLTDYSVQVFEDMALGGTDGAGTSGSTVRPPISPPTGGVTP